MPLTCTCKKCALEVPAGSACPGCGRQLPLSAAHLRWERPRVPVLSWLCWNEAARLALPVWLLTVLLALGLAWLGGVPPAETLPGATGRTLLLMLLAFAVLTGLALLLRGRDVLRCELDGKGARVTVLLPRPTALKLLLRGQNPARLRETARDVLAPLEVGSRELAWKELRRVQLWPEKGLVLLYAPRWWLRLGLPCDARSWREAEAYIRPRLGKQVILPPAWRS